MTCGRDCPLTASLQSHGPNRCGQVFCESPVLLEPSPQIALLTHGPQFINLASGSSFAVGTTLESSTSEVQQAAPFTLDGYSVTLVDTPGFDDTSKSDAEILAMVTRFLAAE